MVKEKTLVPKRRFSNFEGTEQWDSYVLGDIVEFFSGLTYSPSNVVYEGGTFVLRSSNIQNGEIVQADNVYVSSEVVNSENVQIGDIVVVVRNGSRNLLGKHAEVKSPMEKTVIGAFMTGIRYENSSFLKSLLDTKRFNEEISKNIGATINQITNGAFKKMTFYFPQNYREQIKIGEFFKTMDNLINLQQQKITKLKYLKSGYLNDMFPKEGESVPKFRFAGFEDRWEFIALKNIGNSFNGLTGKTKKDFGHGRAEFITYMNVFSNTISKLSQTENVEIDNKQNEVQYGDVLFTTSSETPEEVGMSSVWLGKRPNVYLNSFCFGFRPMSSLTNPYYMAYMLRSSLIREKISFLAQGISRYNISKIRVMDISIPMPDLQEQVKIGEFFRNLDNQIKLQEDKQEKLKQMKQAYLNEMFV